MEIAIDGHSACGKSTLARDLAKEISALYVDSGSMYRAVTLYLIRKNINVSDIGEVALALEDIEITFSHESNRCLLNNEDVEKEIRTQEVSDLVSEVAAIPVVRTKLVNIQRLLSRDNSIVMDGRDIGTVVFPNAEFKFFVTAEIATRVERRYTEYQSKGIEVNKDVIKENLEKRDFIDSTRDDSPLRMAKNAILVDNTHMTQMEQLDFVLNIVKSNED